MAIVAPTKAQVNRAGQAIRRSMRGDANLDEDRLADFFSVVLAYRAWHQYPLAKATMGLRSMVKTAGCRVEVSQRLKRFNTIIDKLRREPTLALANMQDIGGCRAVLDSIADVRRVEQRLRKNRAPLRVADYIIRPRASGYRAVHVIVAYPDYAGDPRSIEVQLRTRTMHEWAIAVERFGGRLGKDLKGGQGPPQVLEWLRAISEAMATEEQGRTVGQDLIDRVSRLRARAVPFLTGGEPA